MQGAGPELVPDEGVPPRLIICRVRLDCIIALFWMTVAKELFVAYACANTPAGATSSSAASASPTVEDFGGKVGFRLMAYLPGAMEER